MERQHRIKLKFFDIELFQSIINDEQFLIRISDHKPEYNSSELILTDTVVNDDEISARNNILTIIIEHLAKICNLDYKDFIICNKPDAETIPFIIYCSKFKREKRNICQITDVLIVNQ